MRKDVYIPVSGQKIKGTVFYPKKLKSKNPAVLFIHGWSTGEPSYFPRAEAVSNKGAICLTISLRGHVGSDGKLQDFSRKDHLKDVIAAYDFLRNQQKVDSSRIGVCGASYGGYLTSILSGKRKIKWIVLRVPALYKDKDFNVSTARVITDDVKAFCQSKIKLKDNLALKAISKFKGDLLLLESENDEKIPHATIENYSQVIGRRKSFTHKIMKNADHNLSTETMRREFIRILAKWFGERI